ncbi:hypothetical protein [Enterococcus faecium]|uniref:hypothetical protein n=1 Tax=Enterococcus faecium TaxID=1352 RepID=UPI001914053E|nr:hypothetical protein [Enterococcus faecium]MBK5028542.1 hypothetical protein [Enterococcus faecium]MBK5039245.1 hypothetical protein [Enterococcus faecium]MBK5044186.1 hypothetical protein [Enterococcus faecium]MBK5069109.1 hypothetical protein [Enterococcus faecium]MBK5132611.1 hypothetical protein [Enterococcus faecium]
MIIEFLQTNGVELPLNQKMDLDKGFVQLKRQNEELLARSEIGWCSFAIYAEGQEIPAYEGEFDLPVQDFHLVRMIEENFKKENEIDSQVQAFLEVLNHSLPKYYRLKPEKNVKQVKEKKIRKVSQKESREIPVKMERTIQEVPKKSQKKWFLISTILISGILFAQTTYFSIKMNQSTQEIVQLHDQLETMKENLDSQGQLDTFCRYFLTNFYSKESDKEVYQEKNKVFLSNQLIDQISPNETPVKSILSWSIQSKKQQWIVSYVISLEENEGKQVTKKVTFTLKEKNKQYQVTQIPELENFEINS